MCRDRELYEIGGSMRISIAVPLAAVFWCAAIALGSVSAQISDMAPTKHLFAQMGRLAGALDACSFERCRQAKARSSRQDLPECNGVPIGNWVYNALFTELMKCNATAVQHDELNRAFSGEQKIYQQLQCPMTYAEAEEKVRTIVRAIEQRDRSVSTCRR